MLGGRLAWRWRGWTVESQERSDRACAVCAFELVMLARALDRKSRRKRGVGCDGQRWYEWRCGRGIESEALRGGLAGSRSAQC